MVIFDKLDPKQKGKMLSLATKTDRTLFFDLLPVDIGKVGNFNLRMQLYTVPGQVFYNETRKLVIRGADSIVFVADSQPSMVESTRESFQNLLENMKENNIDPEDTPIVIQYNKRDIPAFSRSTTCRKHWTRRLSVPRSLGDQGRRRDGDVQAGLEDHSQASLQPPQGEERADRAQETREAAKHAKPKTVAGTKKVPHLPPPEPEPELSRSATRCRSRSQSARLGLRKMKRYRSSSFSKGVSDRRRCPYRADPRRPR